MPTSTENGQAAEGEYAITVSAFGLDEAAQDALFDRVADAAHTLDEQVCCSGALVTPPDSPGA